jgi:hypothetical protein
MLAKPAGQESAAVVAAPAGKPGLHDHSNMPPKTAGSKATTFRQAKEQQQLLLKGTHKTTSRLTIAMKKSTMRLILHGLRFCTTAPDNTTAAAAAERPAHSRNSNRGQAVWR